MTSRNDEPIVVHMDIRKLKPEPETNLPKLSKKQLDALIDEATG